MLNYFVCMVGVDYFAFSSDTYDILSGLKRSIIVLYFIKMISQALIQTKRYYDQFLSIVYSNIW